MTCHHTLRFVKIIIKILFTDSEFRIKSMCEMRRENTMKEYLGLSCRSRSVKEGRTLIGSLRVHYCFYIS